MANKKILVWAVLSVTAVFLVINSIRVAGPSAESHPRGWSVAALSGALQAYRSKFHRDAKSLGELCEFDSDKSSAEWFGEWKKNILWPGWSFRYCGTRPATWDVAQIKGDEIGPYKLIADPNSKYIIIEKPDIPQVDGFRFGIRRADLEVEQIW